MYDVLAEYFGGLDLEYAQTGLSDYRLKSQELVKKTITIPENLAAVTENHVEEAATATIELVNFYHPKVIEEFR